MPHRQVIQDNEIYLASFNKDTGEELHVARFPLQVGTQIQENRTAMYPPIIAINEAGRDTQQYTSRVTMEDFTGGQGILIMDAGGNLGRYWFGTANTRRRRQVTLPEKKDDRSNLTAGIRTPRYGVVFQDRVYVAFDEQVYRYDEGVGWTLAHLFTGGAFPTSAPVEWGGRLFWPLGANLTHFDGTNWTNIVIPAQVAVAIGPALYIASVAGQVKVASVSPPLAGSFTDVVALNALPISGFPYPDASSVTVPHFVTEQYIFAIDTDAQEANIAGPMLPPSPYPPRSAVLSADNLAYISLGLDVLSWDGDTAQNVGLRNDDGMPPEFDGAIRALANGNQTLFALVDAGNHGTVTPTSFKFAGPHDTVAGQVSGNCVLYSREGTAWSVRATSDTPVTTANLLFLSNAQDTYRVWFSFGTSVYSIDLEQEFFNPLAAPEGRFESTGYLMSPVFNFGYHETPKLGLLVQMRSIGCGNGQVIRPYIRYDEQDSWYHLYNADGTFGINTNGRQSFRLHASPIPVSTNPLQFNDEPGVGFEHDSAQLMWEFERGADESFSPGLIYASVYVLKQQRSLRSWTVNLDLSQPYKDKTAWSLQQALEELIDDNEHGLLHFTYSDKDTDFPATYTYAVKITGYPSRSNTGRAHGRRKTARLSMTEVINVD